MLDVIIKDEDLCRKLEYFRDNSVLHMLLCLGTKPRTQTTGVQPMISTIFMRCADARWLASRKKPPTLGVFPMGEESFVKYCMTKHREFSWSCIAPPTFSVMKCSEKTEDMETICRYPTVVRSSFASRRDVISWESGWGTWLKDLAREMGEVEISEKDDAEWLWS